MPTSPSSLVPQPIKGDDLTQYERSVSNLLGTSGAAGITAGAATAQPAIDYWSGILSGNPADVSAALQPELQASNEQFQAQKKVLDQYTPMGGGRSQATANLNTKQAQTNAGIISTARSGAAAPLAQTGLQQQEMGIQQLQTAIQAILQKMGLDIQGGTSNTFSSIMQGIGAII